MKNKFLLLSFALFLGVVSSCKKDDGPSDTIQDKSVILQHDAGQLNVRVDHRHAGLVTLTSSATSKLGKSSTRSSVGTTASTQNPDFSLALVAEVAPPTYGGSVLRATHVAVSGNYAYVSYNTEGDSYRGGVDVIDISDINNPRLVPLELLF